MHCLPGMLKVVLTIKSLSTGPDADLLQSLQHKAEELLLALERKVVPSVFIATIGKIQQQLMSKKHDRKRDATALVITDPAAFAIQKVRLAV